MKILVTGGCGFIGSNLIRLLIQQKNCQVINLDKLTYAGNAASLADLAQHPDYYFEYCDLASPINKRESPPSHLSTFAPRDRRSRSEDGSHCGQKSLTEIFNHYQPDAVMHLAAESHVDRSIDGPGEFIQTNIVGTYNLLQASLEYWKSLPVTDPRSEIRDSSDPASRIPYPISRIPYPASRIPYPVSQKSFRFLHVSTDEVYGSLAPDAPGFSETTPYDPHSPYSASKAASDHLARAWCDTYGLPVLVTNCSNNYGPYQFPEKLTPLVILKCLRGEPIPVYGKGENIRDWLYVEDHAEALYAVLTKGRVGETYNIGGDNERQNIELVKMICGLMEEFRGPAVNQGSADIPVRQSEPGREQSANDQGHSKHGLASDLCRLSSDKRYESLITFVTDRPGHDRRYAIDASKVRDELGWEPKEDSESGFRKTVRWYLENRHWWENILNGEYKLERMGKA